MADTRKRNLRLVLRRTWRFVTEDIWDVELSSMSALSRFGVKAIRVVHLVIRGFRDDECPLHASALTFSTLMSIVPVLAVSLALARGFGAGDHAEAQVRESVHEWTEQFRGVPAETNAAVSAEAVLPGTNMVVVSEQVSAAELADAINDMVTQVFDSVGNINFAALGGIGLAVLLATVVLVLGRVESSFNKVWGVRKGRPFHRKFFDYLGVLVVLPLLVTAVTSLQAADIASRYVDAATAETIKSALGSGFLKNLTMLILTSLAFAFLIMFMPNTRVHLKAGLGGGLVAALLLIVWFWACAKMQIGAVKYFKIYASFAVVPIMLFWVFVSWEIVLFGAEVAFAVQNCTTYRMETRARDANMNAKLALSLSVVSEVSKSMTVGTEPFEAGVFARSNHVPVRLLNEVVAELVKAGLLGELSDKAGHYVLLKAPGSLSVKEIVDVLLGSGVAPEELGLQFPGKGIEEALAIANKGMADALGPLTVRELSQNG